jgi:NADH dehydrogenase/putative oxidoreductase
VISAVRSSVATVQAAGAAMTPWLDLLIRFWLARAFLTGAAVSLVMHEPLTMAGAGVGAQLVNAVINSPFGVAVETICPVLLVIGLFSRLAAVPLLIQALVLQGPNGPSDIRLFWAVLLGWIIVFGPGPFSLDRLLGRGLDSSAVPGVKWIGAAYTPITEALGPFYWLFVRLWIATAPLGVALEVFSGGNPMRRGPVAPWLASVPDTIATMSPGTSLTIAALMIFGLGTRFASLFLFTMIPISHVAAATDSRLYWMLLLAILVLLGPGPLSLDRLLDQALGVVGRVMLRRDPDLPHVVVVGGGFGGIAAARALKGAPCRVTIVDQRNYHLFQPLLYQVATAGLSPADIATPIRSMFRSQSNVAVMFAAVTGVSSGSRELVLDRGRLPYDYLVLATGSQHSYFGRDEWARLAPGLKRIEDATEIRGRLLIAFERAEDALDPAERSAWLTFVVVGGGPTGVELAGAIAELALHGLEREFRSIDPADARVILVQSAPRLLPTFPESLSADADQALRRLGVDVRVSAKVDQVDETGVLIGGSRIAARTVLWAAGVAASPAGVWLGAETDKAGRVLVGPDLAVPGHDRVFAVGDTAASLGWKGKAVPGLAPAAKQGGSYAAKVIRAHLAGRPAPKPFGYRHSGSLATIGRQAAVAEFGPLRFRGALAWWIWGIAHIVFLAGGRNRATVVVEWAWAYLTYRRGIRLITDSRPTS